jgi:NhaP-type Na+/H+ or K+/H+ antiporter
MAEGLRLIDLQPDPHTTKIIAEVTLVWVLFADASRARFSDLREDLRYYVRLLAVGLPLTTALGTAALAAIATQVGMGPRRARAWLDRFGFGRADRCGA